MPTTTVSGLELYYERHGEPRGETPVVLIMGLGMDGSAWDQAVPHLSRTHEVIVFDNRGVGRSGKPPGPYTTRQLADDTLGLMDALALPRAHVVGVSMGGMIAQELALAAPARVRSLCLMATYARPDAEIEKTSEEGAQKIFGKPRLDLSTIGSMMASAGGGQSAPALPAFDPATAMRFMMPLVFSKEYLEREKEALRARFERLLSYGFAPHGFLAQVAATQAHDTTSRLAQLSTLPVLVMLGTKDRLIPPRLTRALHEAIPNARLVEIEGATHGLNLEFADRVNPELAAWIASHD